MDPEPDCPNPDLQTLNIDNCGDCVGVDVSTPNQNMDVFSVCCAPDEKDTCGICFGDNSYCNSPVVNDQSLETLEDQSISINLTGTDPNDDDISFQILDFPNHGSLTGENADWNYTPDDNYNGEDNFTFIASDGTWISEAATIAISVLAVNDAPVAENMAIALDEDTSIEITLPGNDVDGDELSYTLNSDGDNGSVTLTGDIVDYTPFENYFGEDSFTYTVFDGELSSVPGIVTLEVRPVGDAPVIISLADTTITEGDTLRLAIEAHDVDGDELEYFVSTSGNSFAVFEGNELTVIPNIHYFGDIELTITVSDGEFDTNDTITVTVLPENDPPQLAGISPQTIMEDTELIIEIAAVDPDGDVLTFFAESNIPETSLNFSENSLSVLPPLNFNGDMFISVFAFDGEFTVEQPFTLSVLPVNDTPLIISLPEAEAVQGSLYEYQIETEDIDGDELSLSLSVAPSWLTLEGNYLSGIPANEDVGNHEVVITVSDYLLISAQSFTITVHDVNDPPIAFSLEATLHEDESASITLQGSDPDEDSITFNIESESSHGSLQLSGSDVLYVPEENYFGNDSFSYTANDGELNSEPQTIALVILPVNDAPIMESLEDASIEEGSEYIFTLNANDVDGDALLIDVDTEGNAVSELIDNEIHISPPTYFNGDILISVTVSDGQLQISDSFILTVNAVNNPPEIADIENQTILEDTQLELDVFISDPDGDDILITVEAENANGVVDNGLLRITPELNFNGNTQVTITAYDGELESTTDFTLTVLPVNDPPQVISSIEDITVSEGFEDILIDLTQVFYDPENGNNLIYSVSHSISAVVAEFQDSQLILTSVENQFGSGTVEITASDNVNRAVASTSFFMEVLPVNDPPVFTPFNLELDEDSDITFEVEVEDADNDDITINIPQNAEYGIVSFAGNGLYQYTPDADYFGDDSFVLEATDGSNSVQELISVTVLPVNDAPSIVIDSLPDALENDFYSVEITIEDIDNNLAELQLEITSAPTWLSLNGFILSGTPGSYDAGNYEVILELSDNEITVSKSLDLLVENANAAPIVENFTINVVEDGFVELELLATDLEGDEISFSYIPPLHGSLSGEAPFLIYTPSPDYYGEDSFTYTADDGESTSDEGIISIQVIGVNDNPVAENLTFNMDSIPFSVDFSNSVIDPDGDALTILTIPPSPGDILNTIFGGTLTPTGELTYDYNPPNPEPEADFMLFKVSDGISETGLHIATFNFQGRRWSRFNPPTAFEDAINSTEDTAKEITFVGFDVYFSFPLDGSEYVEITQYPQYGSLDVPVLSDDSTPSLAQWTATYTPDEDYTGEDEIHYKVMNPANSNGYSTEAIISLTVHPVNDLPTMETLSNLTVNEDNTISFSVNAEDLDNDLAISASSASEDISVHFTGGNMNNNSPEFLLSPAQDYSGIATITVSAKEMVYNVEQSTSQAFYFISEAIIDGEPIADGDRIFVYRRDENGLPFGNPVGGAVWAGSNTDVVAMGDDGSDYTSEFLQQGDIPAFRIYRLSTNQLLDVNFTTPLDPFINLGTQFVSSIQVVNDCAGVLGGLSYTDSNGECESGAVEGYNVLSGGDGETVIQLFTLEVLPVNDAPILENVDSITLNEDDDTTISLSATDVDYVSLSYAAQSGSEDIQVNISGSLLTVKGSTDYFGSGEITVSVADNEGAEDSQTIQVSITSVNDAPILEDITPIQLNEDSEVSFNIFASDIDSDDLFFDVSSNEYLQVSLVNNLITVIPDTNWYGSESITVSVSDGELYHHEEVAITVHPVNDAPQLASLNDVEINEDTTLDIFLSAEDIDSENLSYNILDDGGTSALITGNILSLTPPENYSGITALTVSVTDGEFTDYDDFTLTVKAVNDAPIVSQSLEDLILLEDAEAAAMVLNEVFSDIDGDTLTFDVSTDDGELINAQIVGSVLQITPIENQNGGPVIVTVTAFDSSLASVSDIFTVSLSAVNDAPVLSPIPAQEINEGEYLLYILVAEDIDGDNLDYQITTTPETTTSLIGNNLTITPDEEFNGDIECTVSVSDGEYLASDNFTLTVKAVNDAPIVSQPLEDLILLEDAEAAAMVLTDYFTDIDGDSLAYSVILDIDGIITANIDEDTLIINTVQDQFGGPVTITVFANDHNESVVVSNTFQVTVSPVNDAPTAANISIDLEEDGVQSIVADVEDIDNSQLEIEILTNPSFGGVEVEGNIITYVPQSNFFGADFILYRAYDGELTSTEAVIDITVSPVNDAPVMTPLENQEIAEGEALSLTLSASDVDGDDLLFTASSDAAVLIGLENSNLTISPVDENFNGTALIHTQVTDGQYTDSDVFELTFTPVNDPPELTPVSDQEIDEDGIFLYSIQSFDVDGDNLTLSAETESENAELTLNGSLLTVNPTDNYNGNIEITIMVSDNEFSVTDNFTLTVKAVNDAPIVSQPLEDLILLEDAEAATMVLADYFTDIDGDSLAYSVIVDIDGIITAHIDAGTLIINTVQDQFGGPITVTVIADDLNIDSIPAQDQFEITIDPVNDQPNIVSQPAIETYEDVTFEYQIEVDDVDDDSFYYGLLSNPEGMVVDSSGLITWTPTEGILSSGLVGIVVWDRAEPEPGFDLPDYQEFSVTVIPVNDPPVVISTPPAIATEDIEYVYQIEVTDPDDTEFNFELVAGPEGMVLSDTGEITWTPVEGVLSSGDITVFVTDGGEDEVPPTKHEFIIVVIPVNDPPIIISTPEIVQLMAADTFYYQILVDDIDDENFDYFLQNAPEGMTVDEDGFIFWIPEYAGDYGPITILVTDGGEDGVQPAVQEIFITVTPYTDMITMSWEFTAPNNLISFLGIPDDSTVATVLEPLGETAYGIIGEGNASVNNNGEWIGSLKTIHPENGYWLTLNIDPAADTTVYYSVEAHRTDPNMVYSLHEGNNLISYVGTDGLSITDAIPDDAEPHIRSVSTASIATTQLDDGTWIGSLQHWSVLKGYWVYIELDGDPNTNDYLDFSFENTGLVRKEYSSKIFGNIEIPEDIEYVQSTQQAFYFMDEVVFSEHNIRPGEWIVATLGDAIVGARQWSGKIIDIPVMGADLHPATQAYCKYGDIPVFKLYRPGNGEMIELTGNVTPWSANGMQVLGVMKEKVKLPIAFNLGDPYPNPFNSATQFSFEIPQDDEVQLSVYDLKGRIITTLYSGEIKAGYHEMQWNAAMQASGVYFVKLSSANTQIIKKIVLMK
ncbi:MAG: tandem-95 repeat protein [Candidatus Marinimicrobia bacterium]|nr:tandem-95 repeat protein [Candidatus Neomarinimicrobiota bacterium]